MMTIVCGTDLSDRAHQAALAAGAIDLEPIAVPGVVAEKLIEIANAEQLVVSCHLLHVITRKPGETPLPNEQKEGRSR